MGVTLMLFGCSSGKMSGMPKYDKKECYYGDGAQDYTDYCKYFYNKDTIKQFENNTKFKKVSDSDLENIHSYFQDFKECIKEMEVYKNFDFDYKRQVKEDDYFYIVSKDGYDKFGYYDVYYVDMTNFILYFIHTNS